MSKYGEKVPVYLPKVLLKEFDRARLVADGRSRSDIIRSLIVQYVKENRVPVGGAIGGTARGATR